jgi:tellurite resistance protein TerC
MLRPEGEDTHTGDNIIVRLARRYLRTSQNFDGDKLFTVENGRRVLTPMLLVMVAIGGTDIMFALDSIPAIFGLTQNIFLVFTATMFSLMGLRQLYFLLDGLLDRLIYLGYGLAAILGFIGVKLILHALHENNVPFINDGAPVDVVEVSTGLSLGVIVGVLLITVVASLFSPAGRAQTAVTNARRYATRYVSTTYETDQNEREVLYAKLIREAATMRLLPEKYRKRIRNEHDLVELLEEAEQIHSERVLAAAEGRTPRR